MDENRFRYLVTPLLEAAGAIHCWPPPGLVALDSTVQGPKSRLGWHGPYQGKAVGREATAPLHCEAVMCGSETGC